VKQKLTLIKLGGSLITDKSKPFTARQGQILRFAKEIKTALKSCKGKLLIAHGSGSFGHTLALRYKTQLGIINSKSIKGFPLVADAAVKINRIVIENFLKVGLPTVSFSPLSFIFTNNQKVSKHLTDQIKNALNIGLIPIVYGDAVMDTKMGFCIYSGEKTLNFLASVLKNDYKITKIIYVTDTDGVYDSQGKTISKITPNNFQKFRKSILGSQKTDVTGGMLHKVEESLKTAKKLKIPTYIINGNKKGNLKEAIFGKPRGTIIEIT